MLKNIIMKKQTKKQQKKSNKNKERIKNLKAAHPNKQK